MKSKARRTIVDVMTGLYARLFPQPSWRPWVLCAAAIFGLTYGLNDEEQAFILSCLQRTTLPRTRAEWAVLLVGRRGGKSRFVGFLAVFLACFQDYSNVLAAGERGIGMVICPDRRQARVVFRYINAFIDHVPMVAAMVEDRTKEAIHLRNGISIEVHTASFRSVRGYTVVWCIVDEVAFLPTDDSAEPDHELIRAILPALATTNGLLILLSSPHAKRGVLWQAMRDHFGKDDDPIVVWKAPTSVMNPSINNRVIDAARQNDPTAAASEWDAEFRNDLETFLVREVIDAAKVPGRVLIPPVAGVKYSAFVDPAGGGSANADDFTGAIVHTEKNGRVVHDASFVRRPPFSPEATVSEIAAWLEPYGVTSVTGDRYAGSWPSDQFRKRGITYRAAEKPKSELYRDFGALLNSGQVELLDDPKLVAQLASLERRVSRNGKDSIDHPPGSHDDLANVVAGAVVHATIFAPKQAVALIQADTRWQKSRWGLSRQPADLADHIGTAAQVGADLFTLRAR